MMFSMLIAMLVMVPLFLATLIMSLFVMFTLPILFTVWPALLFPDRNNTAGQGCRCQKEECQSNQRCLLLHDYLHVLMNTPIMHFPGVLFFDFAEFIAYSGESDRRY